MLSSARVVKANLDDASEESKARVKKAKLSSVP